MNKQIEFIPKDHGEAAPSFWIFWWSLLGTPKRLPRSWVFSLLTLSVHIAENLWFLCCQKFQKKCISMKKCWKFGGFMGFIRIHRVYGFQYVCAPPTLGRVTQFSELNAVGLSFVKLIRKSPRISIPEWFFMLRPLKHTLWKQDPKLDSRGSSQFCDKRREVLENLNRDVQKSSCQKKYVNL